jgi:hypothetical protein
MATISFLAGEDFAIQDIGGSGLGFYGPGGFGQSVKVGDFQDNTYITDGTGAVNGPKADNVKFVHPNSGMLPTSDVRLLRDIPNYQATLNVRFTHTSAVQVQNASLRIFDRVNINAPASGVTTMVAQLIHPWDTAQPSGPLGSGDVSWWAPGGSGGTFNGRTYDNPVSLANSPGTSGWSPNGAATVDTQHDWYVALSASPDSIGSKLNYGLYVQLEYL